MVGETAGVDQTHSPHGASALPSYAPSGCMDQTTQAQARLAMLIMPYLVPDFPCTLPRWLLAAAGRDGLGLVDGLLHRLHHTDSQQRGKATGALPSSAASGAGAPMPHSRGSCCSASSLGAYASACSDVPAALASACSRVWSCRGRRQRHSVCQTRATTSGQLYRSSVATTDCNTTVFMCLDSLYRYRGALRAHRCQRAPRGI